jgi:uncharacterized protein
MSEGQDAQHPSIHARVFLVHQGLPTPRLNRKMMPHPSIITVVTLLILILALPINSALSGRRIRSLTAAPKAKTFRYARTILVLWAVTALALFALRLHGFGADYVGIRPPHHPADLLLGCVSLAAPLLVALFSSPRALAPDYTNALRAVVPSDRRQWMWFIAVAASAGICEEFLYRGYALTILSTLTGSIALGVFASSIAFGLAHSYQGKTGVAGATISGLLYATVYLLTGSLYPCMLGHFVQDIAGGAVLSRKLSDAQALPSGVGSP